MGHPAGREYLCDWIDELAPGQRKYRGPSPKADPIPLEEKAQAVAELESRGGTAAEVAAGHAAGQRGGRVVLQDAEKGFGGRKELWDEGRGQAGHLQVHRALLQ